MAARSFPRARKDCHKPGRLGRSRPSGRSQRLQPTSAQAPPIGVLRGSRFASPPRDAGPCTLPSPWPTPKRRRVRPRVKDQRQNLCPWRGSVGLSARICGDMQAANVAAAPQAVADPSARLKAVGKLQVGSADTLADNGSHRSPAAPGLTVCSLRSHHTTARLSARDGSLHAPLGRQAISVEVSTQTSTCGALVWLDGGRQAHKPNDQTRHRRRRRRACRSDDRRNRLQQSIPKRGSILGWRLSTIQVKTAEKST